MIEEKTDEINIKETSELGEVMNNLDAENTKLDFNTRLSQQQIANVIVGECLVNSGIMYFADITTRTKKLNVSRDGQGREEKVRIASGEVEARRGTGFMNKFQGMFTPRKE